jgi:AIPR protein
MTGAARMDGLRPPWSEGVGMSANDAIVLKANFEAWKLRAADLVGIDHWLYYCVEQFVKPYALDDEELRSCITDGGHDGGADAIFFLVNQRSLVSDDTVLEQKNVSKIRLMIIQCKHSGGFKPTEIEKWLEFTEDFFDLSRPANSFGTRYNDRVVRIMGTWKTQYLKVSGAFPEITIEYLYITGDDVAPDAYAEDSGNRVIAKVSKLVGKANCSVRYIGAEQLWEQAQRRPPKSKNLVWAEPPMTTVEGFVGLVRLNAFYEFIQDDPGVLAERIFESNVRGYQPEAIVNEKIRTSLKDINGKGNFWLLNNGVTIISPMATQAGHLHLSIDDPQIVNGLQTSREIFAHFYSIGEAGKEDKRTLMVRVIQTAEPELQDKIISATNSQNKMLPASLRMTDQIHRDIEELFKKFDLYYDRRKGHYRDQGKPIRKIISVNDVVQAIVSILLQRPNDARARPGDYFKDDDRYESVFRNENITLDSYLICTEIVRRVERYFDSNDVDNLEQRNLKFYVAAFIAREITGLARPVATKLPSFADISKIGDDEIKACFSRVKKVFNPLAFRSDKDTVGRGPELLKRLDAQFRRRQTKKVAITKKAIKS